MRDLDGCKLEVLSMLDGHTSSFWDESQLFAWINEGLSLQARAAQVIKIPLQFVTVAEQGEYKLRNVDVTDIVCVSFHNGSGLYPLKEVDQEEVQVYSRRTSSIPSVFYKRMYAELYEYQGDDGGITLTDADPNKTGDYRCIIGLDPIPSVAGKTVTVWTNRDHPELTKGSQKVLIPYPFARGACAFAAAQALQQEKFLEESKHYYELFQDYVNKLCEYMAHQARPGHAVMKDTYQGDSDHFAWGNRVILP